METIRKDRPSGLARIENIPDDPMDLFRSWREKVKAYKQDVDVLCLATVSEDCKVSARNLVLREFDKNGFVIVTDRRSRKIDNVERNPNAAMCFLWTYNNEQGQKISKQVRVEGKMIRLERHEYQHLYDREPLYCKIRSEICHQGQEINWDELKNRHDETLEKVLKEEIVLAMPEHVVGYKMLPDMMDFYFAYDHFIADRMTYRRENETLPWRHYRVCP